MTATTATTTNDDDNANFCLLSSVKLKLEMHLVLQLYH